MMPKAPCKNCKLRTESCHATCELYLKWAKERNKYLVLRYTKREEEYFRRKFDHFNG